MNTVRTINNAKKNKKDEFYTQCKLTHAVSNELL